MKSKITGALAACMLLAFVLVSSHAQAQTTNGTTGTSNTGGTGAIYSMYGSSNGTMTNGTMNSTTSGTSGTTSTSGVNSTTRTPGVPNTGVGGNATMNFLLLALTGLATLSGLAYVGREVYS